MGALCRGAANSLILYYPRILEGDAAANFHGPLSGPSLLGCRPALEGCHELVPHLGGGGVSLLVAVSCGLRAPCLYVLLPACGGASQSNFCAMWLDLGAQSGRLRGRWPGWIAK